LTDRCILKMRARAESVNIEGWDDPDSTEEDPCYNRCDKGICKKYPESDEYYCQCPTATDDSGLIAHGFQGYKCETAFTTCNNQNNQYWRCYNDAVCGYDVSCTCNSAQFSGRFCETVKTQETLWEKETGFTLDITCPNACVHGSCKYHGETKEYFCDCPLVKLDNGNIKQGYLGPTCKTKFVNCDDFSSKTHWRCYNGAVCGHDVKCVCDPDGFSSGQFCEILADGYLEASREALKKSSRDYVLRREYTIAMLCIVFAVFASKIFMEIGTRNSGVFPFTHAKIKASRKKKNKLSQPKTDEELISTEDNEFVVPLSTRSKEPNLRSKDGKEFEMGTSCLEEEIESGSDLLDYEVSMIDSGKKSRFSVGMGKIGIHSSKGELT